MLGRKRPEAAGFRRPHAPGAPRGGEEHQRGDQERGDRKDQLPVFVDESVEHGRREGIGWDERGEVARGQSAVAFRASLARRRDGGSARVGFRCADFAVGRPRFAQHCANLAEQSPSRRGIMPRMKARVIERLETRRPAIKKQWERLLRAEPVSSPLAKPDTLVFMMDDTVAQLVAALRSRSFKSWLRRSPVLIAPLQARCACGLNPLLAYFATGERALLGVLGELDAESAHLVRLHFHALAQREIDALCGVCCERCGASCPRQAGAASRG